MGGHAYVLVDGDGHEQTSRHGLVRVDGVSGCKGRKSGNLDSRGRVSDDHNRRPWPPVLIPDRVDHIPEDHDKHIRYHGGQTHLRLPNTVIPQRQAHGEPVRQRPRRREPNERADQNGEIAEPDVRGGEVVGRLGEDLQLRQVQRQEARGAEADDEAGELHDGEGEEFPGGPEADQEGLERFGVGLP